MPVDPPQQQGPAVVQQPATSDTRGTETNLQQQHQQMVLAHAQNA
jgi:hypothetical protein